MNAIVVREFGGPGVLRLEERPDPVPGPHDTLVRVEAIGVNPVDGYVRTGTYATKPALPYTPGSDGAGVVVATGARMRAVRPGDRVYFRGTVEGRAAGAYASLAVCGPGQIHPLPARLSLAQGAAIGVPFATAYRALVSRAAARAGETVLVHGASGGVGTAAVQIARTLGLVVLGTAGSPEGLELVRRQGADHVFNHREHGYLDAIRAQTGGRGIDVVIEMLANVNLDHDLGLLAPGGRVVVVGNRGRIEIDPRQTMGKESAILGMVLWAASTEEMERVDAALDQGFSLGTLTPVVGRELPLAEAARAHELVMAPGALGKIVLVP
jgi:NADPH2:quinone reductase